MGRLWPLPSASSSERVAQLQSQTSQLGTVQKAEGVDRLARATRPWHPLVPEAPIMQSRTVVTSTGDSEPSPAAIIGGILALGVVRGMARAQRAQGETIQSSTTSAPAHHRRRVQSAAANQAPGDERCCASG